MNEAEKPTILIVDDSAASLSLLTALLHGEYQIKTAANGVEALHIAGYDQPPELILLESKLPGMDGCEVCRKLKAIPTSADIPVILLTTRGESEEGSRALEAGAVDFIAKPISPTVALTRIRTALALRLQARALRETQRQLADGLREAAEYVRGLLPAPLLGPLRSDWQYVPSPTLGGDAFGHHWLDEDHLAIYLLDVCGQGVGAALLSISAMHALQAGSLKTADYRSPAAVLEALNEAFPMEAHGEKFFTVWYGVYRRSSHELTFASAGHPPALLIGGGEPGEAEVQELTTWNMAIGCMVDYPFTESSVSLGDRNKLVVLSDGVYDVSGPGGQELSLGEFITLFSAMADVDRLQSGEILATMQRMNGEHRPFNDDFSLLEVVIPRP